MNKNNKLISEDTFNEYKNKVDELSKYVDIQNKRNKRFVIFVLIFSLLFSGISSVASYTLGANNVGYTPKDASFAVDNTQDAIDNLFDSVGSSLVGAVYSYMGTSAPFGYLVCDGSVYNISDYPRLAGHINGHFGSYNFFGGDGVTTFAVPDLRGEFLRGTGTNSHTYGGAGAAVGVHQVPTLNAWAFADSKNITVSGNFGYEDWQGTFSSDAYKYVGGTTYAGSKKRYTVRPTNTSVLYIIKY